MTNEQRIGLVLAGLDARDARLENCRIRLTETTTNVARASGVRTFLLRNQIEFRRTASTMWIRVIDHWIRNPGKIAADSIVSWDGRVARGIGNPPYLHTAYHQCRIDPRESPLFAGVRYFQVFGCRVQIDDRALPVVSWLREAMDRGERLTVSNDTLEGIRCVRVTTITTIRSQDTERTLWLDPARDFMIVGFDSACYINRAQGVYTRSSHRALDAKVVGGVWLPMKTLRKDDVSGAGALTERAYDVSDVQIGTVMAADVHVVFPVGSKVLDTTKNIAYFVEGDGKYKLLPLADGDARTVYTPPSNPTTNRIDAHTASLYTSERIPAGPLAARSGPATRLRLVATLMSLVLLLLACSAAWVIRRRRSLRRAGAR